MPLASADRLAGPQPAALIAGPRGRRWTRRLIRRLVRQFSRRGLRRFAGDRRAAVTVEFAMIMPLLITLMLASVEAPAFLEARGSVADATGAIGDLTSQSVAINEDAAAVIFLAADRMVDPAAADVTGLTARLTSALVCQCEDAPGRFCFTTIWSHGYEDGGLAAGFAQGQQIDEIPQELALTENETIIMADVSFIYQPRLTGALDITEVTFAERMFFRPRRSREVTHLGDFSTASPMMCEEMEDGDTPLDGGAGSSAGAAHDDEDDDDDDD